MLLGLIVGILAGILSGAGVGGGTILLIYLTSFAGAGQVQAQGINLLYFLPCSAAALVSHFRNGLIEKKAALPAALAGVLTGAAASLLATGLNTWILKKAFGFFLLAVGFRELFRRNRCS